MALQRIRLLRHIWQRVAHPWMRHQIPAELSQWVEAAHRQHPLPAFGVTQLYACSAMDAALQIRLPVSILQSRLTDWVHCSDWVTHTADHFLSSCDWTPLLQPITRSGVMREAVELQAAHLDFRATPLYAKYRRRLEKGSVFRRHKVTLHELEQLDAYFERYVALFRSVQTYGLLSHTEASRLRGPLGKSSAIRGWRSAWSERDIGVAIGQDGRWAALPGGKHRLAIATVLGMTSVPVEVRMIHVHWLARDAPKRPQDWGNHLTSRLQALAREV